MRPQRAEIAVPPSANRIWRSGAGKTYKSAEYVRWTDAEGWRIRSQMRAVPADCYPVGVEITIHGGRGWRENRDADNAIKPILDLLRASGVIAEDDTRHVRRVTVSFQPAAAKGAEATVCVEVFSL